MIGIIVPFYKNEAFINSCLDSLLAQTFTDYKIIAVDDGSPDKCGEICDEYAEKHKNISVIHQQNQGPSAARNAGLEMALADNEIEWISFVDGDDFVHKDYLKLLLDACESTGLKESICYMEQGEDFDCETAIVDPTFSIMDADEVSAIDRCSFPYYSAWAKLYHKSIIGEIRFPVGKLYEDAYVTYQWLFKNEKIAIVNARLYFYYKNNEGIVHSGWTSKRLDVFPAFVEQCRFLKETGYSISLGYALDELIRHGEYNIVLSGKDKISTRKIRSYIKTFFRNYRHNLNEEQQNRMYRIIYPKSALFRSVVDAFFITAKESGLRGAMKKTISYIKRK